MRLLDAHIHLTDAEYAGYLDDIILGLRKMNIEACSVTIDLPTTLRSFALFESSRDVIRQFVGIHPEAAEREDLDKFVEIVASNSGLIDGIGEIGLDKTYVDRGVPYDRQRAVFSKMLENAERMDKPISVHSRRSLDHILEMLPSYRIKNVLLHWFAGNKSQLARSMDMNLFVSFGPALVYSKDKKLLVEMTRHDRILIETDGPVRYSRCFSGVPAISTSALVTVLTTVANILAMSANDAAGMIEENGRVYLCRDKAKIAIAASDFSA